MSYKATIKELYHIKKNSSEMRISETSPLKKIGTGNE